MTLTESGIAFDQQDGTGVPVVLLHAGVADRRMWDPQWPALAGRRAVRLDLRGFGESDSPPQGALSFADDVVAVLAERGLERCHLVGASLGAGVAVEVALTAPDLVRSLVLSPPGGSLLAEATDDFRAFAEAEGRALEAGDLDAAVEANIAAWVVGPGRERSAMETGVLDAVRRMQRRAFEIDGTWGEVEWTELDPPALERLAEVTVPALVLLGGHDLETTRDSADRLCSGLLDVRRVDWPDAAHLPSLEHPDRFTGLLLDWLTEHDG